MGCEFCPYAIFEECDGNTIWCEKTNESPYLTGGCEDCCLEYESNRKTSQRKARINRYERHLKYQSHLKRVHEISRGYPQPVMYKDFVRVGRTYVENPKPYYKRLYRGQRSSYIKRRVSKRVRSYKGELHNGNMYRRVYDFWWEYC